MNTDDYLDLTQGQLDKLADTFVGFTVGSFGSTIIPAIVSPGTISYDAILFGSMLGFLFWTMQLLVAREL